jgi:hypothetical protein
MELIMAGDSSFDPLALVKAMGPQRDPYSWAEMYAQDAAKGQQLLTELRNRMLIHESDQAARAHEGRENRKSHEGIARQSSQDRRDAAADRLKIFQENRNKAQRDFTFPANSFPADQATAKEMGIGVPAPMEIAKTHRLHIYGPHKIYVPNDQPIAPAAKLPLAPPNPFEATE